LSSAVEIASSPDGSHACALQDGGVMCWGSNGVGQLGDGTRVDSANPVNVAGLGGEAVTLGVGAQHACTLLNTGSIQCWGSNSHGQLGIDLSTPGDVDGLLGALTSVSAGGAHSCALTGAGGVKCWGYNIAHQLGDGHACGDICPAAVDVVGLRSGVTSIEAGWFFTCVITDAGGLKCWGSNYNGQLGNGSQASSSVPVDVVGLSSGVAAVVGGGFSACALTTAGAVKCWGSQYGNTPQDVAGLQSGVADLAAGTFNTCAVTSSGAVMCGFAGGPASPPTVVPGMESGMTKVSVGDAHVCAITAGGGVKCQGENLDGQLGNGTTGVGGGPAVDVLGVSNVLDISVGAFYSCALTTAGAVHCWGSNAQGQIGIGVLNTIEPVAQPVTSLDHGVVAMDAATGGSHNCALAEAGGVTCWGWNPFGQLGNGVGTGLAPSYVPIDSDSDNCSDGREMGNSAALGGERDPLYSWDFFDVPTGGATLARDESITIGDVAQEVLRFGTSGDGNADPLNAPPSSGYHTAYDRGGVAGENHWDQAPPNGSITVSDIVAVVGQFGHTCA
jgi:alpha-tubulin suppressor-like RCC1 family protein